MTKLTICVIILLFSAPLWSADLPIGANSQGGSLRVELIDEPPQVKLFACDRKTCVVVRALDSEADYAEVRVTYRVWAQGETRPIQLTVSKITTGAIIKDISMMLPEIDIDPQDIVKVYLTLYRYTRKFEIDPKKVIR